MFLIAVVKQMPITKHLPYSSFMQVLKTVTMVQCYRFIRDGQFQNRKFNCKALWQFLCFNLYVCGMWGLSYGCPTFCRFLFISFLFILFLVFLLKYLPLRPKSQMVTAQAILSNTKNNQGLNKITTFSLMAYPCPLFSWNN